MCSTKDEVQNGDIADLERIYKIIIEIPGEFTCGISAIGGYIYMIEIIRLMH